jgi:hypothetical protein
VVAFYKKAKEKKKKMCNCAIVEDSPYLVTLFLYHLVSHKFEKREKNGRRIKTDSHTE